MEVLAMRGRHKDILAAGRPVPDWHFGMLESRIDFRSLPTPFPFLLAQPQSVTEEPLTKAGRLIVVPLPDGRYRVTGYDPANQRRDIPLTLEELRQASLRIAGTDFGMRDPSWLTRFGNATKLAAAYRDRRVLLAGDAAHIHFPAGGVGLNVGLQDAMNLGWKLAAVLQGRAGPQLLDTYHAERHPVGAESAEHTRAQTALITGLTPEVSALDSLPAAF